jgi:hypothetical protein
MTPHRPPRSRLAARARAALLLAGLALAGCNRQPHFVSAAADSTLHVTGDSLTERVRVLQERWGEPGRGEEAARLTAALLLGDLRARQGADDGGSWAGRARTLLDSLDVGAEASDAGCALAVNFFSRGDPAAGSWPWVFWCVGGSIQAQAVEGQGMNLIGLASRGLAPVSGAGAPALPGIAALFARRSGGGPQPLLLVWRAGPRLELAQTLGPDSLGGVGSGSFATEGDSGATLATRTWRPTARFDECSTCPHVFHERRFRWGLDGFERTEDRLAPSPYVAFVQLIQALTAADRDAALLCVTRPALVEAARRAGLATVRGPWRAAPGSTDRGDELIFFRGSAEAWKVTFARRGDTWLVDAFEPTTRVIE